MILILIAMIIGIGIAIFQTYNGWMNDFIDYKVSSFVGIVVGAGIGLIVAIMLPMDTYGKHYSLNIETLQDIIVLVVISFWVADKLKKK